MTSATKTDRSGSIGNQPVEKDDQRGNDWGDRSERVDRDM